MNDNKRTIKITEQLYRIEVLEQMLNENVRELKKHELYEKKDNSSKTAIINQIVILRNELLTLSKQIKSDW